MSVLRTFVEKADSLNIVERTLGIAAINAVSQYYFGSFTV